MEPIKLIIYEDRTDLRSNLELMLGGMSDLFLSGAFPNCKNVEKEVSSLKPDVVRMDFNMPEYDGLYGLARIISSDFPDGSQVATLESAIFNCR